MLVLVTITWNRGQFAEVGPVAPVPLVHTALAVAPLSGTTNVGFAAVVLDNEVVRPETWDHKYV